MKVTGVERILVDVPFTGRQQRITKRTVYNWSILELCRVTADSGHGLWERVEDGGVVRAGRTS